jgi:plastocyanin
VGRKRQQNAMPLLSQRRAIIIGSLVAIASAIGIFGYYSAIPVNGTSPVVGFPINHFIKATHSSSIGYHFLSQSSGSVKGLRTSGGGGVTNPSYQFAKDGLQSIHFINSDYDTQSRHNFNIDEFNVHTRDLGYFEAQTVTFVTDKAGVFEYYCTLHPEMKGTVTVE